MIERIKQDWMPFIAFVLLGMCVLLLFKRCEPSRPVQVAIPTKQQAKVRNIIKWKAIVQNNEVIKWKVYKEKAFKDTANPCGNEIRFVIQKADTVIRADSSLIASQRELIQLDSAIIFKQSLILKADSIHIVKLDKKIRRNRRLAAFLGAIVAGGVAVRAVR